MREPYNEGTPADPVFVIRRAGHPLNGTLSISVAWETTFTWAERGERVLRGLLHCAEDSAETFRDAADLEILLGVAPAVMSHLTAHFRIVQ